MMNKKYHLQYIDKDGFIFAYREFNNLRKAMNRRGRDIELFVVKLGLSLKIVEV